MAYWLVKSEPSTYSFDQLVKDGSTTWDGVRNYAARNNLRAMKKNDQVFYYHSNGENGRFTIRYRGKINSAGKNKSVWGTHSCYTRTI